MTLLDDNSGSHLFDQFRESGFLRVFTCCCIIFILSSVHIESSGFFVLFVVFGLTLLLMNYSFFSNFLLVILQLLSEGFFSGILFCRADCRFFGFYQRTRNFLSRLRLLKDAGNVNSHLLRSASLWFWEFCAVVLCQNVEASNFGVKNLEHLGESVLRCVLEWECKSWKIMIIVFS